MEIRVEIIDDLDDHETMKVRGADGEFVHELDGAGSVKPIYKNTATTVTDAGSGKKGQDGPMDERAPKLK